MVKSLPGLLVIMGPAGAGKSSLGRAVAAETGAPFFEGDDFHPPTNVAKMTSGQPLTAEDRAPWILAIGDGIRAAGCQEGVLACSALNAQVREALIAASPLRCRFVLLNVPQDELARRLASRKQHFMKADMLASQLAAMDACAGIPRVAADRPFTQVTAELVALWDHLQRDS